VRGYDESTYGNSFADVYDEWYRNVSRIDATVDRLRALGGDGPFLELGVGTGRLALPLAATGASVTGIDTSDAMLDKLAEKDPGGTVKVVRGDMVDDLPTGPFAAVFVAYNTLFNLADPERQAALFHAVSARLEVGGHFVVEAFVPDPQRPAGSTVTVRTMAICRSTRPPRRRARSRSADRGGSVRRIHRRRTGPLAPVSHSVLHAGRTRSNGPTRRTRIAIPHRRHDRSAVR
jgi:SAM-dependent methyltransferase